MQKVKMYIIEITAVCKAAEEESQKKFVKKCPEEISKQY